MSIDDRPELKVLVGLGSLLHDIQHDHAAVEAHDLSYAVTRELVGC